MDPSRTSNDSPRPSLDSQEPLQDPTQDPWTPVTKDSATKTPSGASSSKKAPPGSNGKPQNHPSSTSTGPSDASSTQAPTQTPTISSQLSPSSNNSNPTSPSDLDEIMEDAPLETPPTLQFILKIPSANPMPIHRKVMETILAANPGASILPTANQSLKKPITSMSAFPRSTYKQFFHTKFLPQSGPKPAVTIVQHTINTTCNIQELKKSAIRVMNQHKVKMINRELDAASMTSIGWLNGVIP